ncbi:MAG: TraB/GumN family protein [Bacillota bacterium]
MKRLMIMLSLGLIAGAVFVFTGCEPAEEVSGSKGIFYRVDGGDNDLYLFGSLHFGVEEMYPLHDAVYDAFAEADVLGMELDMQEISDQELNQVLAEKGMLADDTELTDIVPPDVYDDFMAIVDGPGLDEDLLMQYKPWLAAFELSILAILEAGYNPELGVEEYLMEMAEEEELETLGLETVAMQFAPFDKLSEESQVAYLEETIEEYERAEEELSESYESWIEGDVEAFAEDRRELIEEAETESLREFQVAFTDERDQQMTDRIEELLHDQAGHTYFITVGSMHLAGENSIVDLLEDRGYNLENIY